MDSAGLWMNFVIVRADANFQIPQFTPEQWLQLTVLVVSLILCTLASAAETALTSISRIKLKNLVGEGDAKAIEIDRLLAKPNIFLSTILIVNSVAVIVASSMATVLALSFSINYGELLSTILISLVVLIFCEITPKTAAVQNPLRWARALVGPVRGTAWLLRPLVWALSIVTSALVRMTGGQVHRGPFVTEEELRLLVTVGEEEGVLEGEETDMIHSVFEFADTKVYEVMVPRVDMLTLEGSATVDQAVDLALQKGFSRIPVYDKRFDNIIGVLYTKDMLEQLRNGHNNLPVRDLVSEPYKKPYNEPYFVPGTKRLDDLLREIRKSRRHIAIVVDEYGGVDGLVTIEDLVEEIIGDIQDEYDREDLLYEKINENKYNFDAKISIDEFNEIMGTELKDEDYETLGGFMYDHLDKIPTMGDSFTFENLTFTVLTTRERRVTKVRVERVTSDQASAVAQADSQGEPSQQLPTEAHDDGAQRGGNVLPAESNSHSRVKRIP